MGIGVAVLAAAVLATQSQAATGEPAAGSGQKPQASSTGAATAAAPAAPRQQAEPARPAPAPAQEGQKAGEETYTTLETVVRATATGVPLTYAGGRDVIDQEIKEQYPDGNISTLLRRVPGVYILPENDNDSRLNIGLRGTDPRRSGLTAVLVDGIPICEAPYGNTDVDGMPVTPERVWMIDVIRGGGSIRYGPNSAGGIVNFLTEPIPQTPMMRFGSRLGSHGDFAESLAIGGTYDKLGFLATGVWKGGDGWRDNSEYTNYDGSLKMAYALSPTETLSGYVSYFDEPDAEQPGGLTQAAYEEDPSQSLRPGSTFDFNMSRYVLAYANQTSQDSTLELKGWYQEGWRQLYDFRPIVAPYETTRVQESDFDSGALEAAYSWETQWGGLEHSLRTSARYLKETNDEFYYRDPLSGGPTVTPYDLNALFKGQAFSLFAEDMIALTDELDFGLGFRLEDINLSGHSHDDGSDVVKDYTELLPESTLTWKFRPRSAVYASYQQSFYVPQYETGFDPASVIYAPTDPESADLFELGLRSRELEGLEWSTALFDTEYDDKIDYINTPQGQKVPVNTGQARAYGVEAGLGYDVGAAAEALEGLFLYGSLTAQRSTIESGEYEGNDTPNSPHLLASWGAEYEIGRTGLWTRLGGSYCGESYKDQANTSQGSENGVIGLQPAYTLWDVAAGWHQRPDRTGLSLSVGVTNLLDEEYFRRFVSGIYPGAPRALYVLLSYTLSL